MAEKVLQALGQSDERSYHCGLFQTRPTVICSESDGGEEEQNGDGDGVSKILQEVKTFTLNHI